MRLKMINPMFVEVIKALSQIESDNTVPRNIRFKIRNACVALEESDKCVAIRIDKSLQELDEVSNDPNVPMYARAQIWDVVTRLESLE
jgi:hypothetical protein